MTNSIRFLKRTLSGQAKFLVCVAFVWTSVPVFAQEVRLVPDSLGPYAPGQVIDVDIFLDNNTANDINLNTVQLDYNGSTVTLPPVMVWALQPPAAGNPLLPFPSHNFAGIPNIVPANDTLRLGTVQIQAPLTDGCYLLDVINVDGLVIHQAFVGGPITEWRASDDSLTNGQLFVGVNQPAEICDGLDNDCDGLIDEDFWVPQWDPDAGEVILIGPGNPCIVNPGEGDCEIQGRLMCSTDGMSLECVPVEAPIAPGIEGPYCTESCFDLSDNDCDGLVDEEDPDCQGPEKCDYIDNDFDGQVDEDFPNLGNECTVGQGPCARNGVFICDTDGTVTCSATPMPPGTEGPPDHFSCDDGFDNDCDGLVDLEDPDCQSPEVCDGLDNDGDRMADEDFPTLGQVCSVGIGPCERQGVFICHPDGNGVICSVSPGTPGSEGPGCGCADGIDNDCDTLIDLNDPDCGGTALRVQCALPLVCTNPAGDCNSWHTVDWQVINPGFGLTETARLVGLDTNGVELVSVGVSKGDEIHIASNLNNAAASVNTVNTVVNDAFFDFVTANCLLGPDITTIGAVCAAADTDCDEDVDLKDFHTLQQQVNMVRSYHILTAPVPLLIVEAQNTHGKARAYCSTVPYLDVIKPDDQVVSISDGDQLSVEVAIPAINLASLSYQIDGVDVISAIGVDPATQFPGGPFGGSVSLPNGCDAEICNLIVDAGSYDTLAANTLTFDVRNLCCGGHGHVGRSEATATPLYTAPVVGTCTEDNIIDNDASFGLEIDVQFPTDDFVNPLAPLPVSGQVCYGKLLPTPTPSAGGFINLNGASHPLQLPVLTPGDGFFTRDTYRFDFGAQMPLTDTFNDYVLGVGVPGTLDPGPNRLIAEVQDEDLFAAHDVVRVSMGNPLPESLVGPPGESRGISAINRGLTLTMEEPDIAIVVEAAVEAFAPLIVQELNNALNEVRGTAVVIPTDPCDIHTTLLTDNPTPVSFSMDPNAFTYAVNTGSASMDIIATSGPVSFSGSVSGKCQINGPLGLCAIRVKARLGATVDIAKVVLSINVTEGQLQFQLPVFPSIAIEDADVSVTVNDVGSDVECWAGVILQILTLGTIEPIIEAIAKPIIQNYINDIDITPYVALIPVPPVPLDVLEFDPIDIQDLGVSFSFDIDEVDITSQGLAVAFETDFEPLVVDPQVQDFPNPQNTLAALPQPILLNPSARGMTVMISDDAMNDLLFALTKNGILLTEFEDVRPLESVLPANCGVLPPDQEGQCEAVKGTNCFSLPMTPEGYCLVTEGLLDTLGVTGSTPLALHAEVEIGPKFQALETPNQNQIDVVMRLSQLRIDAVLDRDGDGIVTGPFTTIPACFGGNSGTGTQCSLGSLCYDATLHLRFTLIGAGDSRQLVFDVTDFELSTATGCAGSVNFPGGLSAIDEVFASQVFDLIQQLVEDNVPPLDLGGLTFDNIIILENLRTITHGNQHDPDFEDYFGLSADPATP